MLKLNVALLSLALLCACDSEESRLARLALERQDSIALIHETELALEMRADSLTAREEIQALNHQILVERLNELNAELETELTKQEGLKTKKNAFTLSVETKIIEDLKSRIKEIENELR